jgi:hypothetical protein
MTRFAGMCAAAALALLAGCGSSNSSQKTATKSAVTQGGPLMAENTKHPLSRYIELAGFRLTEPKPGRLRVAFAVINHSNANVNDLGLNVALRPTTAKPGDEPFCTFTVSVPPLPPNGLNDVAGECATKLRVYELPDWQFIRPSFQITSPPM